MTTQSIKANDIALLNTNNLIQALKRPKAVQENRITCADDESISTKLFPQSQFVRTITCAFDFKETEIVKQMFYDWNKKIQEQTEWASEEYGKDAMEEIYQIKRIHIKELVKLINLGKIVRKKYNMGPEISLALCLGILYATFIFENTCMYLTINEIYLIIPENIRNSITIEQFRKDFFVKGTDKDINKILYSSKN